MLVVWNSQKGGEVRKKTTPKVAEFLYMWSHIVVERWTAAKKNRRSWMTMKSVYWFHRTSESAGTDLKSYQHRTLEATQIEIGATLQLWAMNIFFYNNVDFDHAL